VTWPAVLSLAAGTYLIRLTGLLLRGRVHVPAHVERYLDLGATALIARYYERIADHAVSLARLIAFRAGRADLDPSPTPAD
jgi:branched-subunit amino acid transport protein